MKTTKTRAKKAAGPGRPPLTISAAQRKVRLAAQREAARVKHALKTKQLTIHLEMEIAEYLDAERAGHDPAMSRSAYLSELLRAEMKRSAKKRY